MIRLWELNQKRKTLPLREPIRALRSAFTVESATELFQEYYHALKKTLFERSLLLKYKSQEGKSNRSEKLLTKQVINGYRAEIHTLGATIAKYRDFFLRTQFPSFPFLAILLITDQATLDDIASLL